MAVMMLVAEGFVNPDQTVPRQSTLNTMFPFFTSSFFLISLNYYFFEGTVNYTSIVYTLIAVCVNFCFLCVKSELL